MIAKRSFPAISWGAVFGGLISGMAGYLLLALLGLAIGFSAINPQGAEPVGKVPMLAAIWTGISMLAAAFIGGYVATRMSGLTRKADGVMHGLVSWGVSTLFFAWLITTSVGAVVGGAFSALGKGLTAAGGATAGAVGTVSSSPEMKAKFESLITGSGEAKVNKATTDKLQQQLKEGDRDGAINVMVKDMGFTRDRATTVVDQGMALYGSAKGQAAEMPQKAQEVASTAVSGLKTAFFWLFGAVLLSMGVSIGGGAYGAHAAARRRIPLHH